MIRFYAPYIAETLTLPESDSAHCTRVLRLGVGDEIEVVDGRGMAYSCRIVAPHQRHTMVEILSQRREPKTWTPSITLAVAPTKSVDRMEWMVEKLTEMGVDRVVPLLCNHSERRELKEERLVKIAVSAMKQSLKALLPAIDPLTPFARYIQEEKAAQRFICYCDKTIERIHLATAYSSSLSDSTPSSVAIAIGPEGDFSPAEVEEALKAGWQPVSLGPSRLRTETAALMALAIIHTREALSS
ncbi:MAG: 16S rRNA (uracil(1498)-N(3))-methyltransferase [Bacteroidales bacterium]|nr:16S rRNA (uracil(1498)-N(3))-methyltransferase [Bacteroidales bacterium]